ncbi:MAG: membrane protein insertase YidC, partial [Akkermansia sp.]|nr:membrane protein insertase YidC [Akkermansia sp.]
AMSSLQPEMQKLKEKYPNDQQKVSMEMMKLYRDRGISPMGGCLPMFLQIPVFFAFFYVLQTAAEFRGAPFLGWVTDLSQMDTVYTLTVLGWDLPINILPVVMAVSMIVQMAMTPQAGDPMQQRIMKFMPVIFFLFCYTYPSALALYWTTTNIISIIQTLIIRRMPLPEPKTPAQKKKGKKGFIERMMEAQQAALAEQQRQAQMRNVTPKK